LIPICLLRLLDTTHREYSVSPCFLRGHARSDTLLNVQVQAAVEFIIELAVTRSPRDRV